MIYMKKAIAAMCSIIACASFMTSAVVSAKSETLDQISKNMPEGTMILIGDIDGSEVIDVTDLTLCSLWLLGDVELEDSQKMCADTNMDAALNISDLANFGAYCAKKVPEGSANMIGVKRSFSNKQIEREPFPEGYIMPVNREDNTYDYATYKENTYTKRCVHVFDETQLDEKKVNPFVRSNNGGVMEFARTVKGISSDNMFLVKCGNEEGKYFVFLNESLTEEEAKKIYDQFGITEYTTPEPKTFPEPEQPIPTPAPTAAPVDGTDYSKVERDPEAIKSGFSGLREATEEEIAASKNQPDKDKMPVPTAVPNDGTDYSKVERDPEAIENGFSGAREATEEQIAASKNQPDKDKMAVPTESPVDGTDD